MIDKINRDLKRFIDNINIKKKWNLEYKNFILDIQLNYKNINHTEDKCYEKLLIYNIDIELKNFLDYINIKRKWNFNYNNFISNIKLKDKISDKFHNEPVKKNLVNNNKINKDLKIFIDYISIKRKWNLDYKNFIPEIQLKDKKNIKRCIGRLWDGPAKKSYNYEDLMIRFNKYNINKQCNNYSQRNGMCESCNTRKDNWGRVDEYPSLLLQIYTSLIKTRLIRVYDNLDKSKYTGEQLKELSKVCNRNVYKELDLNNYELYIKKINKNYIKKISNNECKDMLELNSNNYKESYYDNDNEIDNNINIEINNNMELYKTDIYQDWWDSELTDKIKIYDNNSASSFIFAMEDTSEGKFLLNKNQQIFGEYREWEDKNNEILDCFKNNDNKIIHPESAVPLLEFEVFKESSLYHNITCKIYREFRYNKNKETLVDTNCIELL